MHVYYLYCVFKQLQEFIEACKSGEIDKLIDICLQILKIEGEAAQKV